jgi:uncharacterized FAD-dependent dehydrogenase
MYVHFGHNFWEGTQLNRRFRELMERLAKKNAWFAPVSRVLDFLRERNGNHVITDSERATLERRWLLHKLRYGGS